MRKLLCRLAKLLLRGEEGASFTEYGLLLVVVVLAIAASGLTLRTSITTFLNAIGTEVAGATIPNVP